MANYTVSQVAELLASARRAKGMTQQQLAQLLDVPQSYVAKIESGKTDIRTSKLMELARLLDLEVLFVPRNQLPVVRAAMAGQVELSMPAARGAAYRPDEDAD